MINIEIREGKIVFNGNEKIKGINEELFENNFIIHRKIGNAIEEVVVSDYSSRPKIEIGTGILNTKLKTRRQFMDTITYKLEEFNFKAPENYYEKIKTIILKGEKTNSFKDYAFNYIKYIQKNNIKIIDIIYGNIFVILDDNKLIDKKSSNLFNLYPLNSKTLLIDELFSLSKYQFDRLFKDRNEELIPKDDKNAIIRGCSELFLIKLSLSYFISKNYEIEIYSRELLLDTIEEFIKECMSYEHTNILNNLEFIELFYYLIQQEYFVLNI